MVFLPKGEKGSNIIGLALGNILGFAKAWFFYLVRTLGVRTLLIELRGPWLARSTCLFGPCALGTAPSKPSFDCAFCAILFLPY